MKKLAIFLAASVIGTAAYAQTTVIQKEDGLAGSRTVVKQRSVDDAAVVKEKKVITTGSTGCASKTVKKTDEFGDSRRRPRSSAEHRRPRLTEDPALCRVFCVFEPKKPHLPAECATAPAAA